MHSPIHHPQSLIMYLQSSVRPISDHPKWEYLSGHLQEVVVCNNGSGGSMGGGPPLILRPNWGPKGGKNFFWRPPAPPLISGRGWPAGPRFLIWRSGSAIESYDKGCLPRGPDTSILWKIDYCMQFLVYKMYRFMCSLKVFLYNLSTVG